jgi:putative flavoprotein involved in K+ transport
MVGTASQQRGIRGRVEAVIIGAGPSGLALSHELLRAGLDHVVLERGNVAERWRSERWDSLTLLTPNWMTRLPGLDAFADDPDGYATRDEIVDLLARYAAAAGPIRTGVYVTRVRRDDEAGGYSVETNRGRVHARIVVVATGPGERAPFPAASRGIPREVLQLHSSQYRNPERLPPGAVLVVGSGASGMQIAEELMLAGRRVFLSLGRVERAPRRYRGKDVYWWADRMGALDIPYTATGEQHESFHTPSPAISGVRGGQEIDPRMLAEGGVVLLGRIATANDGAIVLAPDLATTLAAADESAQRWRERIDEFIRRTGMDMPEDEPRARPAAGEPRALERLHLRGERVTSVVWATGFRPSVDWVEVPVLKNGWPVEAKGVTASPGLYFFRTVPHKRKGMLLFSLREDAAHLAEHVLNQKQASGPSAFC